VRISIPPKSIYLFRSALNKRVKLDSPAPLGRYHQALRENWLVARNLHAYGSRGPEAITSGGAWSSKRLKLSMKREAKER